MASLKFLYLLATFLIGTVASTSPSPRPKQFKPRNVANSIPQFPFDPNASRYCVWWFDSNGTWTCRDIEANLGVSVQDLLIWNPSLNSTACGLLPANKSFCVAAIDKTHSNSSSRVPSTVTLAPVTTTVVPAAVTTTVTAVSTRTTPSAITITALFTETPEPVTVRVTAVSTKTLPVPTPLPAIRRTTVTVATTATSTVTSVIVSISSATSTSTLISTSTLTATATLISTTTLVSTTTLTTTRISTTTLTPPAPPPTTTTLTSTSTSTSTLTLTNTLTLTLTSTLTLVPPPTSTTPNTGIATPSPIQPGMTSRCRAFYYVRPGDTCAAIAARYSIPVGQFIGWNPGARADCASLWANTYACVGVF
ncbi:hypothetical protein B0T24DRAFT_688987 [Lasiosphaeria ovina]|uniref:LysM domain-containing protein n=1 Tax=Lasiosphaeria ovina TaxID=92902 RepID=A0AAE0TYG7_9PEZI|nr:hypothetical protein B0T24DRAFT_688987 [Lasiosphaeria ovina]